MTVKDIVKNFLVVTLFIFLIVFPLLGFISMQQEIQILQGQISSLSHEQAILTEKNQDLNSAVTQFLETWQVSVFEASAYSPLDDKNGLNSWGNGELMNSGVKTRDNISTGVSVDPSLIPYDSKVWIQGIGWRTALDAGGAIKGNKLDIPMNTFEEAMLYGVGKVVVVWPKQQESKS